MENETEIVNGENQNEIKKRDRPRNESSSSEIKSIGDISSPDAKKIRNDSDEVMETIDVIDNDMAVVYSTRVLSKLDIETDDINVKKLIDCYNPVLRGDIDMMKKHMLDVSESWTEKEKAFKNAIRYVLNDENEIIESNIGDLAESLLAAIENRMPTFCKDCDNWYIVGRENKPKLFCTWCKVGMHNCKQVKGIEELKGIRWFCKECNELFTEQIQPKLSKSKNILFQGFEEKDKEIRNATKEENLTNKEKEDTNNRIENNDDIIVLEDEGNDNKNKDKRDIEKKGEEQENRNEREKENKKETKILCWFWKNRKCKYGDKCKNDHPEQCKPMMEYGECRDNRCKLSHPTICRSLYYERYCSRNNCWFTHPTKIVNKYTFIENNSQGAHMINTNQQGWNQRNMNPNSQWSMNNNNDQSNQNNNGNNYNNWSQNNNGINRNNNNNFEPFLGHWPTPSEASRPMKMMLGKIMEEIATRFMNM